MFNLTGKVAIVTGGGTGIGRQLIQGLSEHGANVVIADIDADTSQRAADDINGQGGSAIEVRTDVCDKDNVDLLVKETISHFGKVDILVNNAGGGGGGPTATLPLEAWHFTMNLTVTSAFLCSQRAGREMIDKGGGRIINVASVYGFVGQDFRLYDRRPDGQPTEALAYAAGKGAIVNMTRALAVYWARYGINVNAIAPGMVRTERLAEQISQETWERLSDRTPLGRPGRPQDMAGAVVFLSSPAAAFVTGETIAVDGGWLAW